MYKKQYLSLMLSITFCLSAASFNPAFSIDKNIYNLEISKTYEKIDNLVDLGSFKEAENMAQSLLSLDPNNVKARAALANIYSEQYKIDAAFRELKKATAIDPNNSDVHNALGMAYYHKTTSSNMDVRNKIPEYYAKALKEFNNAISLNNDNQKAYNNAGKIYREMGKLDKAEEYFRKAISASPNYSEAVMNLGTVLYQKNQPDEAISKYYKAIELNKKNSSAYYHLGEALVAKGEYSKAINYLNTSLYLFSNSAPVHNMLGNAYELQGNEAAALSEYKKSTLIKPEYSDPYLSIANVYETRNDNELAISELKNAIAINPDFLEGKLKIADISLRTNDTEQAIKNYKAVIHDPAYAGYALKGLSKAYFARAQQMNDYANFVSDTEYTEAENALKEAIRYNPEDLQLYLAMLRMSRLTNDGQLSRSYLNTIVQSPSSKPINSVIKGEAYLTYR
ncbi:MAG: tetratricopeptide repeat protein, partial [Candidatus Gastranaerophilaceae bacterium]